MGRKKRHGEKESFESFLLRPRSSCVEIAPELARLNESEKGKQQRLLYIQKMMERARIQYAKEKIKYIAEFDHSDKIPYHGEFSKKLFQSIASRREYDLYARQILLEKDELEERTKKLLAIAMGSEYKKIETIAEKEAAKKLIPDVYDREPIRALPLTTPAWNVGDKEHTPAPVGFADAPAPLRNSLGNELYYSYNGDWKDGMMHGRGTYLYSDGMTYSGGYKRNRHDGKGISNYSSGSCYEGYWEGGKFDGKGTMSYVGGSIYRGEWKEGRRHGHGHLVLRCGLEYEGDWVDGVPHGRGRMHSTLTGYSYEGSFHRGSIFGGGTLITPPPDCKKHIRFWSKYTNGLSLPGAVRVFIEEQEEEKRLAEERRENLFGAHRDAILKRYSTAVRMNLHQERARVKKEKNDERIRKAKETKQNLLEAKMKLLEDEMEAAEEAARKTRLF
eukprot:gene7490-15329_t